MKLSHKLALLLVVASCFVATPVLYITYQNVSETAFENEEESFSTLIDFEFEIITNSYLISLNDRVESVMNLKELLSQQANSVLASINSILEHQEITPQYHSIFIDSITNQSSISNITSFVLNREQSEFPEIIETLLQTHSTDIKGRTLIDLLNPFELPMGGDFASFNVNVDGVNEDILFFFLPFWQRNAAPGVIVSYVSIEDFQAEEELVLLNIIENVQTKFDSLELYEAGFIALIDEDDTILASSGSMQDVQNFYHILEEAREGAKITRDVEFEDVGNSLVMAGFLKPLGWTMVSAAPYAQLQAPGQDLVRMLTMFCIASFLISVIASLILLGYIVNPLQKLTKKVDDLRNIDLNNSQAVEEFTQTLPTKGHDEIAVLANNFSVLTKELSLKISDLLHTTASKERMQGELNAARDIQMNILNPPSQAPNNSEISSAFYLEPAKEVGGDLYDYMQLKNGKYALVIGDVSGKGVPAALFMSMTATLIRYSLHVEENLSVVMENVNKMLAEHNEANMFVTLLIIVYDPITSTFEYVNGGHCQPYAINKKSGEIRLIEGLSGPMVGVFEEIPYPSFTDTLYADETLLAFTDGVTEAMNEENALYSDERLAEFLKKNATLDVQEIIDTLYESILDFRKTADASDDITIFSFAHGK